VLLQAVIFFPIQAASPAGRNITQPDRQLPDRSVSMIRPRAAELSAFLGEHSAECE